MHQPKNTLGSNEMTVQKKRGRPAGSKNKPTEAKFFRKDKDGNKVEFIPEAANVSKEVATKILAGRKKRVLQPKVTVMSVRREWEQKYHELAKGFEGLAKDHMELAKRADEHFDNERHYAQLAEDRLVEIHRHQGVIIYLENKLGTPNH